MASRKQLWHPDEVRAKIQASQLINRLTSHALSDTPLMDASQVNAAKILLGKAIPDLTSVEHKGTIGHRDANEITDAELVSFLTDGSGDRTSETPASPRTDNSIH